MTRSIFPFSFPGGWFSFFSRTFVITVFLVLLHHVFKFTDINLNDGAISEYLEDSDPEFDDDDDDADPTYVMSNRHKNILCESKSTRIHTGRR